MSLPVADMSSDMERVTNPGHENCGRARIIWPKNPGRDPDVLVVCGCNETFVLSKEPKKR